MIDTSKIIYSINNEDAQNVAEQEIGRKLTEKELKVIENKIGDYIDWYEVLNRMQYRPDAKSFNYFS